MTVAISKTRAARVAVAICSLSLLFSSSAGADVRSVAVDDPADATPTISGTPQNPDVSKVTASYDSAGSITMTIDFYNDFTALDYSLNYAFWSSFSFGGPYQADDPNTFCSAVVPASTTCTAPGRCFSTRRV